jgi:hypothetical protein
VERSALTRFKTLASDNAILCLKWTGTLPAVLKISVYFFLTDLYIIAPLEPTASLPHTLSSNAALSSPVPECTADHVHSLQTGMSSSHTSARNGPVYHTGTSFCCWISYRHLSVYITYSPHFRRKSLRGVSALVRFGGNVYCWVDERAAIGRKQYDAPGSYTTTQTENI